MGACERDRVEAGRLFCDLRQGAGRDEVVEVRDRLPKALSAFLSLDFCLNDYGKLLNHFKQ